MTGESESAVTTQPVSWGRKWSLLIRIIVLTIWVVALHLWLGRHFRSGVGIDQLLITLGVPAVSVIAGGVLGFLLDEGEQKALKEGARGIILRQLSPPLLILLYVAAGTLGFFRSTLTVAPGNDTEARTVAVASIRHPDTILKTETTVPGEPLDIGLWIDPYFPQYRLSLSGYLPTDVTVTPFVGATIVPSRDLVRLPTVFFRPSFDALVLLRSKGSLVLYRFAGHKVNEIGRATGGRGRYAGPARPQPPELAADWRLDATAANMDDATFATLMKEWRHPAAFDPIVELKPGDRVCVLVTNIDQQPLAGAIATIGAAEYIDIPIEKLEVPAHEGDASHSDHVTACARLDDPNG